MREVLPPSKIPALLILCLLYAGCLSAEMVNHFTDNGYGNPLATMQHPCAEHYQGVTYIAYQGPHEDPYVCAYNHVNKAWSGPVQAGNNLMGKTPDTQMHNEVDNHGRPALVVDSKGFIHLFFGGHGGFRKYGENTLGTPGKGKMTHVVSKKPADISAWEECDNIPPFGTYTQLVKMDDGDIYLFYRHGSHRSDWVYQKSTDECRSFAPPVSVLKHKTQVSDRNIHDAWYAWFNPGKGDTITASYIYHPCKVLGHTKERYHAYYMIMNCADASWENVTGDPLEIPVTKEAADSMTLVRNTGRERSNHGTCHVDSEGKPHVFFRQGKGQVRYYRWTGAAWQEPVVVSQESQGQDGDFIIESPQVITMLLSQRTAVGGEVACFKSTDAGLHWEKGKTLIASPEAGFVLSALVRNAHPDAQIVASEHHPSQGHLYRKLFLLGDQGPVQREEAETRHLGDRLEKLKSSALSPKNKSENKESAR